MIFLSVQKYLEDFKFGTAVSDDLYERIQEVNMYINVTSLSQFNNSK